MLKRSFKMTDNIGESLLVVRDVMIVTIVEGAVEGHQFLKFREDGWMIGQFGSY